MRFIRTAQLWLLSTLWLTACVTASRPALDVPANWIELDVANRFTVHVPPDTSYEPQQGIDAYLGTLRNPDFTIEFRLAGYYGDRPVPTGSASERVRIDGRNATIIVEHRVPDRTCAISVGLITGIVGYRPPARLEESGELIEFPPYTLDMYSCTDREEAIATIKRVYASIRFRRLE